MRLAAPLALVVACAPASAPPRPSTAAAGPERALPTELRGVLAPWQALDLELAESAPVWLLARYEPGTYPCRPGPDGSLDMLVQDRFTAQSVVRGQARAPGVDLDLHALRGPHYPRAYAEGRRYLLFIQPGPKGQAILADPGALGRTDDRLGPDEVVQVIDLDQTEAEARADQVTAAPADPRRAPPQWDALREATSVEAAPQRELAEALQRSVVRPRAAIHEVRAALGAPDGERITHDGGRVDEYILARPAYQRPTQDGIHGHLRLRYDGGLELREVELAYLRWRVTVHEQSSVMLTAEEHAALGLPRLELDFP